jgi:hypothetical protein
MIPDGEKSSLYEQARQRDYGPRKRPFHLAVQSKQSLPRSKQGLTSRVDAGWSSPVARQAHNLKVTGSNPVPATKYQNGPPCGPFAYLPHARHQSPPRSPPQAGLPTERRSAKKQILSPKPNRIHSQKTRQASSRQDFWG